MATSNMADDQTKDLNKVYNQVFENWYGHVSKLNTVQWRTFIILLCMLTFTSIVITICFNIHANRGSIFSPGDWFHRLGHNEILLEQILNYPIINLYEDFFDKAKGEIHHDNFLKWILFVRRNLSTDPTNIFGLHDSLTSSAVNLGIAILLDEDAFRLNYYKAQETGFIIASKLNISKIVIDERIGFNKLAGDLGITKFHNLMLTASTMGLLEAINNITIGNINKENNIVYLLSCAAHLRRLSNLYNKAYQHTMRIMDYSCSTNELYNSFKILSLAFYCLAIHLLKIPH